MSSFIETNGVTVPPHVEHERTGKAASVPMARSSSGRKANRRSRVKAPGPYDDLLWRLQSRHTPEGGALTIGLIGGDARAGVTTIASNLAVRASELNLGPVLIVEADVRRPRLAKTWKLERGPGLVDLLRGEASYSACLRPGPVENLAVMPAGRIPRGDNVSWTAGDVDALIAETCADNSLVFFDLPAAGELCGMLMLARRLDQALVVIRAESDRDFELKKRVDRLLDDGVAVAGAILNRKRSYVPGWLQRWM
jgi:Mrp family chromosome partitioning ATPase